MKLREFITTDAIVPELQATDERAYRTPAKRPKYSALRNARLEAEGYPEMPPLEKSVAQYLELAQSLRPMA